MFSLQYRTTLKTRHIKVPCVAWHVVFYYSPARAYLYLIFADVHGGGTSSCSTSGIWSGCK